MSSSSSSSLCSLHYPFITLIIFFSLSNGEDTNYTACSSKFSCGTTVRNVGYPFWGDDRPKFCGILRFKLSCRGDQNDQPFMDVLQNSYHALKVLSINTTSHTIVFNQSDNDCLLRSDDKQAPTTLLRGLKPDAEFTRMLNFSYGCSSNCTAKNYSSRWSYNCSDQNGGSLKYYVHQPLDTSTNKPCPCNHSLTYPVDKRGFDELMNNSVNASLMSILNKWPSVKIKYEAHFSACSKCEDSGGRCGSSEDLKLSNGFVCYCRDGTQRQVCPPKTDQKKMLRKVLGSGAGVIIVFAAAIVAVWLCKKKNSKSVDRRASLECSVSDLEKGSRYYGVPLFSYRDLAEATNNFDESEELGNGGFGIVYHGRLKDGREVAVKRLYEKNYKRIEQFMNEIYILTRLRHHNLVSLYGCTSQHCRELLLVYEYVNNGTVADHLFSKNTTSRLSPLSWPVRLRIAIETAAALSYLHASDIIHRDVKTNNILLDSNFSVKVADFGLSRLFPTDVTHVSTAPQGTPGYVDPEYHQCYQLTDKSDVYSFGVVLIELISSLPAIDMDRHRNEINLSNYAINRIRQCAFEELVDPQLGFATDFKVRRMTISVAELAFQCLQHDKEFRPSMDEVLEVLKKIEGADYEALLQAEEISEKAEEEVKLHCSNLPPPPSPTENDHEQLLRNHQPHPPSPISVIGKWTSRSTSSSNSK